MAGPAAIDVYILNPVSRELRAERLIDDGNIILLGHKPEQMHTFFLLSRFELEMCTI